MCDINVSKGVKRLFGLFGHEDWRLFGTLEKILIIGNFMNREKKSEKRVPYFQT